MNVTVMRNPLLLVALLGLTVLATACGASGAPAGQAGNASSPASAAGDIPVPQQIRSAGQLTVGTSYTSPPFMYAGGSNSATGVDADLLAAIGKELGLKVVYSNLQFQALVPAVTAGRYDIGALETADTAVREKTLNFIDYYKIEDSVLVRSGNPKKVSPSDLCGVPVSSSSGSFETETLIPALNAKCQSQGKPSIKVTNFSDTSQTVSAVLDGRDDAYIENVAVNAYTAKTSQGKLESLPTVIPGSAGNVAGFYVAKDNKAMVTVLVDAIKALQANGTWTSIFKKWGIDGLEVSPPTVNTKPWSG